MCSPGDRRRRIVAGRIPIVRIGDANEAAPEAVRGAEDPPTHRSLETLRPQNLDRRQGPVATVNFLYKEASAARVNSPSPARTTVLLDPHKTREGQRHALTLGVHGGRVVIPPRVLIARKRSVIAPMEGVPRDRSYVAVLRVFIAHAVVGDTCVAHDLAVNRDEPRCAAAKFAEQCRNGHVGLRYQKATVMAEVGAPLT
jgi:hypothetical protein